MTASNRVNALTTTVNVSENFGSAVDGWTWRASNAGPSSSQITDSGVGAGKCLQLSGGSLGHYEELQFLGYLDPHGSYSLTYKVKADAGFAAQLGDAGWYLQFFTAAGETVRLSVSSTAAATTQWQTIGPLALDCASFASTLGLNSHVIKVGLLLVNAKYQLDHTAAAALYVTDIGLSGTSTAQPYGYDANGNVTAAPARNLASLSYEAVSGLTSVVTLTGVEAQRVSYAYDSSGLRSAAVTDYGNGVTDKTLYLRDPFGNLLMRRQTQNGVESATSYLQCRSGLLAAHTDSGERYIVTDNLGSTRVTINTNQVEDYNYGPFGDVLESPAGNQLAYRYTGQEQDPVLVIDNYNARLYDPALRRFYASDPAAQYASPYVYVGNEPIPRVDPDGRLSLIALALGGTTAILAGHYIASIAVYLYYTSSLSGFDPGPGKYELNWQKWMADLDLSYDWKSFDRAAVLKPRTGLSADPRLFEVYYPKLNKTELLSAASSYYNYSTPNRKYNFVYFEHSKELRLWEVELYELMLQRGDYFHSQLAEGKNVDCAGEIYTDPIPNAINAQSGHYFKSVPAWNECVGPVKEEITRLGYDLSGLGKKSYELMTDWAEQQVPDEEREL